MDRVKILELGRVKINEGKTRQTTFEELKIETNLPIKQLAEIVKLLPPKKTKEKYKLVTQLLIVLLITTTVIRIGRIIVLNLDWFTMSTIVSGINIILIIGLTKLNTNNFKIVAVVSGASLFSGFPGVFKNPIDYSNVILFSTTALTIVLGYYLYKKMAPDYKTKRELYINEIGQQRGRDVIYFND